MGGGSGHEPRDDGDVWTRKESEQRLEIDRPVQLLCLTVGASPEHLHRHSGRELENAICESLITAGGDSWMGMDGRRTSLTAPKNRIHRLWHSGLLLQQRWQHVGAEGEQAMQGDGGLGRCWVCGCGVGSALPAGRIVASTRSTEGERALRTRRGGAMLAAKQQIYLGGNYQPTFCKRRKPGSEKKVTKSLRSAVGRVGDSDAARARPWQRVQPWQWHDRSVRACHCQGAVCIARRARAEGVSPVADISAKAAERLQQPGSACRGRDASALLSLRRAHARQNRHSAHCHAMLTLTMSCGTC